MASTLQTGLTRFWALGESTGTRVATVGGVNLTENGGAINSAAGNLQATAASFAAVAGRSLTAASLTNWQGDYSIAMRIYLNAAPSNQGVIASGDLWLADSNFIVYFNGTNLQYTQYLASGAASASLGSGPPTGGSWAAGWYTLVVRHNATAKTVSAAISGYKIARATYTGTQRVPAAGKALKIGIVPRGDGDINPLNGLIEQVAVWSRALTDLETLALVNANNGLAYASWDTAFPDTNTIPGLRVASRISTTQQGYVYAQNDYTLPGGAASLDTFRTKFAAKTLLASPTISYINAVNIFGGTNGTGEDDYASKDTITIASSILLPDSTAVTAQTFSGASTKALAYSGYVETDPLSGVVLWPGEFVYVNVRAQAATGSKVPANRQFSAAGGEGGANGTDRLTDTVSTNFTTLDGLYGYGPIQLNGFTFDLSGQDTPAVVGDSITDGPDKYPLQVLSTANIGPYTGWGRASEKAATWTRAGAVDAKRSATTKSRTIWYELGVNDCRSLITLTNLQNSTRTIMQAHIDGATRKILWSPLTPLTTAANASDAGTTARNAYNAWMLGIADSAALTTFLERPARLYTWSGSAWVAQGVRGTSAGNPVDVYILKDVNKSIETSFPTITGTFANFAGHTTDGVHPNLTAVALIKTDLLTQTTAALNATLFEFSYTISGVTPTPGTTATVLGEATLQLGGSVQGSTDPAPPQTLTGSIVSGPGTVDSYTLLFTAPGAGQTAKTTVVRLTAADNTTYADITITTPAAGSGGSGNPEEAYPVDTTSPLIVLTTDWQELATNSKSGYVQIREGSGAEMHIGTAGIPSASDVGIVITAEGTKVQPYTFSTTASSKLYGRKSGNGAVKVVVQK